GVQIYVDGKPAKLKVLLDELNQSFDNTAPLRIGAGGGAEDGFNGLVDEVRVYTKCLSADEAAIIATPETLTALAVLPPEKRSPGQRLKLRAAFLDVAAPAGLRR